ncbi:putative quinol monooxygenase [Amycolatopsis cihanbeyliensis]|uniref:Antibiotic biosynthesis monooxygenase n=1 Tax=Amycolatopsis cihanbeyliensis TaxID=1128664 RepID=A0A542DL79_AMYCI|nr:antibiotic biosynthesis monooxygenase [Amycolatopsis cihanbeyliensis]TQJ03695.1 antibiotic biosynthesis monooxygenase [Amycolatopsis cihanbeyliensis]
MFGLTVLFRLRDADAAGGFDALVARTLPLIEQHEPGTLVYAVHEVEGDPLARVFYELYADRAAFEEHERAEHTKRFLAEREQYLAEVRVDRLNLRAAKGVG